MKRAVVVAALVVVANSAIPVVAQSTPPPPLTVGNTSGYLYCSGLYANDPSRPGETIDGPEGECSEQWNIDVVNGPSWSFNDTRRKEGSIADVSYTLEIGEAAGYELVTDASGNASSLHVHADLHSDAPKGGELGTSLSLNIPFRTTAPTVHITNAADATADGSGDGEPSASSYVWLGCGDAAGVKASIDSRVEASRSEDGQATKTASPPLDADFATAGGFCLLQVSVEADAETGESSLIDSAHGAKSTAHLDVTVTAAAAECDLEGTVYDGNLAADGHANKLSGIPVALVRGDELQPVGAVTDGAGHYCLRDLREVDLNADDYVIRASLVDRSRSPSLFKTLYADQADDVTKDRSITNADVGAIDFDLEFSGSRERPWLADVANIHWQSTRFVNWLTGPLGIAPATLGEFTVSTFDTLRTSYTPSSRVAHITRDESRDPNDSLYKDRDTAYDEGPENLEWHEISHHVAHALGIAPTDTAAACNDRIAHGGWQNASTCDSLAEGLASFLPILGSLTIDAAALGPGYATPDYAHHEINLEANNFEPTSTSPCSGSECPLYREDFAVAQLLWDLVDGQAEPNPDSTYKGVRNPDTGATLHDEVTLKATDLLPAMLGVTTVAELYAALNSSSIVPAALKAKSIDITADGTPDVSKLDAVFLMHGFHASRDLDTWYYTLGDPIGSTDHPSTAGATGSLEIIRDKAEPVAGAAIKLVNPTSSELTFTIDVDYTSTTSHFEVPVGATSEYIFGLELPPYWHGLVESVADLPACTAADEHQRVTVTISAPGVAARTIDNCEYIGAVATATGDSAISYGGELPSPTDNDVVPGPTATPGAPSSVPAFADGVLIGVIVAGVAAVIVILGVVVVLRRRRSV